MSYECKRCGGVHAPTRGACHYCRAPMPIDSKYKAFTDHIVRNTPGGVIFGNALLEHGTATVVPYGTSTRMAW